MKKQQSYHAGRILLLLVLALLIQDIYPFVAILLAIIGFGITFVKIDTNAKIERTWKN